MGTFRMLGRNAWLPVPLPLESERIQKNVSKQRNVDLAYYDV